MGHALICPLLLYSQMTQPDFRALLADDAYAVSFQSLGQYRTALLKALDATPRAEPPMDGEVAELVARIRQIAFAWELDGLRPVTAAQLVRAAELLERTATPPPEPPSEKEIELFIESIRMPWILEQISRATDPDPDFDVVIVRAALERWGR